MKPEQQRIAIAEACGWTDCHKSIASVYGFPSERKVIGIPPQRITHTEVPDYLNDLNAMHEAEKILNTNQAADYCELLRPIICGCWRLVHATAAQRAEAFLRTLNLWTD